MRQLPRHPTITTKHAALGRDIIAFGADGASGMHNADLCTGTTGTPQFPLSCSRNWNSDF